MDIHFRWLGWVSNRDLLNRLQTIEGTLMSALDDLKAKVDAHSSVVASAVELLNGLANRVREAGSDETKLAELASEIEAETQNLARAVASNTIVDPATDTPAAAQEFEQLEAAMPEVAASVSEQVATEAVEALAEAVDAVSETTPTE